MEPNDANAALPIARHPFRVLIIFGFATEVPLAFHRLDDGRRVGVHRGPSGHRWQHIVRMA